MGEYADMVISDSFGDYIRNRSYQHRQANPCEFGDFDGEIFYVNTSTGEIFIRDVRVGKEIPSMECCSCGSTVVIRQNSMSGKYFIGCTGFPKCRRTYSL